MQFTGGFRNILIYWIVCVCVRQNVAVTPIRLPILDLVYQRMNNFSDGIRDTNIFFEEYDFIVIGSGSGGK